MNFATKAAQRMASPSRHDLVLLGPVQTPVPSAFTGRRAGSGLHKDLLSRMQRFRGATYLKDGAITAQSLDAEGRHCTDADWHSWHILAVDEKGDVRGCSRYTSYRNPIDFGELAVGRSALAQSDVWGAKLKMAIDRARRKATEQNRFFVELGGWAISENLRCTTEALRIALATCALGDYLGGGVGVTTATVRHNSAGILRKIGGSPLVVDNTELPRYFDPQYNCEMEILCFDSTKPSAKFLPWINLMKSEMAAMPVITAHPAACVEIRPDKTAVPEFGATMRMAYGW